MSSDSIDAAAPICNWCGEPGDEGEQGRLVHGKDGELYHFGCLHKAAELAAVINAMD